MANINPQDSKSRQDLEDDVLDRAVNEALAKFAAVEPRAGLEQRVLANLRSHREHGLARASWYRPALYVTAALVILVAVSLVWRVGNRTPVATSHRPTIVQHDQQGGRRAATNTQGSGHPAVTATTHRPARQHLHRPRSLIASAPKLEQFPSPQPLSEQEQILESYVLKFQDHAALVARARMESLQQDLLDEAHDASNDHETGNE